MALLLELETERQRGIALGQEVATLKGKIQVGSDMSSTQYQEQLHSEINGAICSRQMLHVHHGPDTVEHFNAFSMTNVIAEQLSPCV